MTWSAVRFGRLDILPVHRLQDFLDVLAMRDDGVFAAASFAPTSLPLSLVDIKIE
ncbi:MAG: hypothetical protein WDN27_06955 [Candidatus Saccharibacteria bacterium]